MNSSKNKENFNFISNYQFKYNKRFLHKNQSKINESHNWCNMENIEDLSIRPSKNALNVELMEKLALTDIAYEDLALMTDTDLNILGFEQQDQRSALIEVFNHLPNQRPSYESILNTPEAQRVNNKIIKNTVTHLKCMNAVLANADSKLNAEGDILADKQFVCRFVIETLTQLNSLSDEIDKEAQDLKKQTLTPCKNRRKTRSITWLVFNTLATGILAVMLFLKLKKQFK